MRADGEAARFIQEIHLHEQLGDFGNSRHSRPASSVCQMPSGVTIQPSFSFRKNIEMGICFSFETVQCAPPSSVDERHRLGHVFLVQITGRYPARG